MPSRYIRPFLVVLPPAQRGRELFTRPARPPRVQGKELLVKTYRKVYDKQLFSLWP